MSVSGAYWFLVWLLISPAAAVLIARRLHRLNSHYPSGRGGVISPGRGSFQGKGRAANAGLVAPPGPAVDQTPDTGSRSGRPSTERPRRQP